MSQSEKEAAPPESLLAYAQRLKNIDREKLAQLAPTQAQAEVDAILLPAQWKISQPSELAWSGDMADDPEEPHWMAS